LGHGVPRPYSNIFFITTIPISGESLFWLILLMTVISAVSLTLFFRRKGWL